MITYLAFIAVSYVLGALSVFFITLSIPSWAWYMAILLLWFMIVCYLLLLYIRYRLEKQRNIG